MRKANDALRLQPSLKQAAERLAAAEGTSLNQFINVAVAEKLSAMATVGLKSMQHFRAASQPLADAVLVCDCGALCSPDVRARPFRKLRRPIWPLDPLA